MSEISLIEHIKRVTQSAVDHDHALRYHLILTDISEEACKGHWIKEYNCPLDPVVINFLKQEGFSLTTSHHQAINDCLSCHCKNGCDRCETYDITTIAWHNIPKKFD
jgi:hypothetical protein